MILSTQQLQEIKAWLASNAPGLSDEQSATAINSPTSPDFWVWRTSVTKSELVQSTGPDGTTFNWTGNGFIGRSAGELAAWQELFDASGSVNPALANVRQAFADIFSGAGVAAANRTHLIGVCRRLATKAEKLFAVGTGSAASPATMATGCEGVVTIQNVVDALSL